MGGKFIKHNDKVKYLCLTLNQRLSWRQHINDKINTCKGLLLNITNKYRHTSKAKPTLMKWIYTGVIRPKLTYGGLIWGPDIKTNIIKSKLNSLNRMACLLTANVSRTTQMSLENTLHRYWADGYTRHIRRVGLTAYKWLEHKLDKVLWRNPPAILGSGPTHCHTQISRRPMWGNFPDSTLRGNAELGVHKQVRRCRCRLWCLIPCSVLTATIFDRITIINTNSFNGRAKHTQRAETTIYTDGSKTEFWVGAGFTIYHENKRLGHRIQSHARHINGLQSRNRSN